MSTNTSTSMSAKPRSSLWVWVGLAFGLLIAAWSALFVVATKYPAEEVPLKTQESSTP